MLLYLLRIALLSLKRNPVLSVLLVAGIALGIGVSSSFMTTYYLLSGNPIPHKSDDLFYVQMDSWDPDRPWDDDNPAEPPTQLTYRDMMEAMKSDIPTYKSGMYRAVVTVYPEGEGQRPYREIVRMCFRDFFPMFEVPFRYGTHWGPDADAGPEPVVVLDHDTNLRLFGGENSVGRTLRLEDREFTIVGVLDRWRPIIKFYDTHNGTFEKHDALYLPLSLAEPLELGSAGNTSSWKNIGETYQDRLQSEAIWLQMWVQLESDTQRRDFLAFLDAYALEQKSLGRFQRPLNNRVRNVMEFLALGEGMPPEAKGVVIVGLLFLVVCSVNLIGILLGKFLARSPEVGVRRALGASRLSIFAQHLIECELVALMGGIAGLGLSVLGMRLIERIFQFSFTMHLDLNMVMAGIAMALLSGLVAGAYPAWRICRIAPATHLSTQ
jgi:putative ABC transport system permease protein